jgi:hypothetical protein
MEAQSKEINLKDRSKSKNNSLRLIKKAITHNNNYHSFILIM